MKDKIKNISNRSNIRKIICLVLCFFILLSASTLFYCNFVVDVEHINIETADLSDSFDGYKIAHISDYHNRTSDLINKQVFDTLNSEKPDIIVFTGDLVDSDITDVDVALDFLAKLCEIAPVYYVTGNHESNVKNNDNAEYERLCAGIEALGVKFLRGEQIKVEKPNGEYFNIYGVDDPYFFVNYDQVFQKTESMCAEFTLNPEDFNVLLAHHPEPLQVYSKFDFDVVFSGHAHGGQVTFFGKAIVAPDQRMFPPYTNGLYERDGTSLIVSRGLGNSTIPFRFFSNPHIIITEIRTK